MGEQSTFIEKHGLWDDDQRRQAAEIKRRRERKFNLYVCFASLLFDVPEFDRELSGRICCRIAARKIDRVKVLCERA